MKLTEQCESEQLQNCTFRPNTSNLKTDIFHSKDKSFLVSTGITKFLERQEQAHAEKERREQFYSKKGPELKDKKSKINDDKSYTARFAKNLGEGFEESFKAIRRGTFADGVDKIHQLIKHL